MNFLSFLKKRWNTVLQIAFILVMIISKFTIPPNFDNDLVENQIDFISFSKFIVAAIILLLLLPAHYLRSKENGWVWWFISLITIILGIYFLFSYNRVVNKNSVYVHDYKARTVTGNEYTPEAKTAIATFSKNHPSDVLSKEDLIQGTGGPEHVWYKEDIMRNSETIIYHYLSTVICFAIFIVCAIQAVYTTLEKN
jgi:hypothetical protein